MGFPHNCEGETHWGVLGTGREQGSYRGVGRYPGKKKTKNLCVDPAGKGEEAEKGNRALGVFTQRPGGD